LLGDVAITEYRGAPFIHLALQQQPGSPPHRAVSKAELDAEMAKAERQAEHLDRIDKGGPLWRWVNE
jgi:hypothetical protein